MAASSDDVGCVLVMELCHDPQTRQNESDSSSIIIISLNFPNEKLNLANVVLETFPISLILCIYPTKMTQHLKTVCSSLSCKNVAMYKINARMFTIKSDGPQL